MRKTYWSSKIEAESTNTHSLELVEKCRGRFLFFENGEIACSGGLTAETIARLRAYFEGFN